MLLFVYQLQIFFPVYLCLWVSILHLMDFSIGKFLNTTVNFFNFDVMISRSYSYLKWAQSQIKNSLQVPHVR